FDPKKIILQQVAVDKNMRPIEVASREEGFEFQKELGDDNGSERSCTFKRLSEAPTQVPILLGRSIDRRSKWSRAWDDCSPTHYIQKDASERLRAPRAGKHCVRVVSDQVMASQR
ncbi:unnamed protein product, partial [Aphanomyces euteiches]